MYQILEEDSDHPEETPSGERKEQEAGAEELVDCSPAAVSTGEQAATSSELGLADPWGIPPPTSTVSPPSPAQADPWSPPRSQSSGAVGAATGDPWAPLAAPAPAPAVLAPSPTADIIGPDPWAPLAQGSTSQGATPADPWAPKPSGGESGHTPVTPSSEEDEFAEITQRAGTGPATTNGTRGGSSSPWDMSGLGVTLTPSPAGGASMAAPPAPKPTSKSPHSFLGENSNLVNLDNLIGPTAAAQPPHSQPQANPFGWGVSAGAAGGSSPAINNPFQAQQPPAPSINQIRDRKFEADPSQPPTDPWASPASAANPFLS